MCLVYSSQRTSELRRRLENEDKITVYKVVYTYGYGYHRDIRFASVHMNHTWKGGWNLSTAFDKNRKDNYHHGVKTNSITGNKRVDKGFHVYLNLREALGEVWQGRTIIPLTAYKKDFIAGGKYSEAVFTKVFLAAKDCKDAKGNLAKWTAELKRRAKK